MSHKLTAQVRVAGCVMLIPTFACCECKVLICRLSISVKKDTKQKFFCIRYEIILHWRSHQTHFRLDFSMDGLRKSRKKRRRSTQIILITSREILTIKVVMSPWVLKFPMCYCLRWRHGGTSEKIVNLAERNFHRPSKQNGRPDLLLLSWRPGDLQLS